MLGEPRNDIKQSEYNIVGRPVVKGVMIFDPISCGIKPIYSLWMAGGYVPRESSCYARVLDLLFWVYLGMF